MKNLIFSLNATVPVFLLMALGFLFRKLGWIDEVFASKMNQFVFLVPLPLLVFEDLASVDFQKVWNLKFVLFCFFVTLASIALAGILSLLWKDRGIRGEFIQASYRSSAALLGIAFIQNIYGDAGLAPLMIIGSVPLYNMMAVVVLSFFQPEQRKRDKLLWKKTLKGIVTNPIIIGIAAGLFWSALRIPMPYVIEKTVAGYLNYSGKIFHEKDGGAEEANADLANQELLDISEEDIETVGDEIASNDSDVEGTPGEAVLTNGSAETTVAQAKVTREQVRAQNKETLQAIIDNTNLSESEKQEAVSQLVQMTQIAEQEAAVETMMASKGFSEAVVSIDADSADIVVKAEELTDANRAQIEDIVLHNLQIEKLHSAISELPTMQKHRLIRYFFEGLSYEQIAKEEGCSKVAVKYSIDKAVKKLKEILK